jgi:hypothetical protein
VPGQLTGVGQTGARGAVYRIDPVTGVATQVNTIPTHTGTQFGVDFNPVPDALRIVSDADQNLRITMGGAGVVNTDGSLNPGNSNVVGVAYANNVQGGRSTDRRRSTISTPSRTPWSVTQGGVNFPPGVPPVSPNTGTLFPVGSLGVDTAHSTLRQSEAAHSLSRRARAARRWAEINGCEGTSFPSRAPS